jgi:hypothetical protein
MTPIQAKDNQVTCRVSTFRKSLWESNLNHKSSSPLIQQLKNNTRVHLHQSEPQHRQLKSVYVGDSTTGCWLVKLRRQRRLLPHRTPKKKSAVDCTYRWTEATRAAQHRLGTRKAPAHGEVEAKPASIGGNSRPARSLMRLTTDLTGRCPPRATEPVRRSMPGGGEKSLK